MTFPAKRLPRQPSAACRAATLYLASMALLTAVGVMLGRSGQNLLGRSTPATAAAACPTPQCPACPQSEPATASETAAKSHRGSDIDCPACPKPPECPTQPASTAAADGEPAGGGGGGGAGSSSSPGSSSGSLAPLVCGGPGQVPLAAYTLNQTTRAILAGADEAFARWRDTGFTLEDLMHTADILGAWGTHDTHVWVEVREGRVTFPRRFNHTATWYINEWIPPVQEAWDRGLKDGRLKVPEGVPFLWNMHDDDSPCGTYGGKVGPKNCTAPLLSLIRHADNHDVLMPPFKRPWEPVSVPWAEKSDVAFFRGTPWCDGPHGLNGTVLREGSNCSRESLTVLAGQLPDWLNVSLVRPYGRVQTPEGEMVSHYQHGFHKYLLQLDGISASRRFATLLSINSLVLKQASVWLEWYYHALHPCVHYLPFWQHAEHDVLSLLRALRGNPANELTAQRVAGNANAFAAAWLDEDGQYRYLQMLVDRYVKLYRGSTNPATLAAKRRAERVGQEASRVGMEADTACKAANGKDCWGKSWDAMAAKYMELTTAADAAAGGGAGGDSDAGAAVANGSSDSAHGVASGAEAAATGEAEAGDAGSTTQAGGAQDAAAYDAPRADGMAAAQGGEQRRSD